MKPKVLYIFHSSDLGGASWGIYRQAIKLKNFTPEILLKSQGSLSKMLAENNFKVNLESKITPFSFDGFLFNPKVIKRLILSFYSIKFVIKKLRAIKPDLVILNSVILFPYSIACKKLNINCILQIRENWNIEKKWFRYWIAQQVIKKNVCQIIGINSVSAKLMNVELPNDIVYNWVDFVGRDIEIPLKENFGLDPEKEKIFLFLGGLSKIKGSLDVVRVFSDLLKKFDDIRLLVVGGIEPLNGIRFKKLREFLNISSWPYKKKVLNIIKRNENIIPIPKTMNIKSLIEQSYCLVAFPTVYHAMLPVAEAGFLGILSIAVETPEIWEYTDNGNSAIVIPFKDSIKLQEAIEDVIYNKNNIIEKMENSKKRIQLLFDKDQNAMKLEKILTRVNES